MHRFRQIISTIPLSGMGFLSVYLIAHIKSLDHLAGNFTWFDWLNLINGILIFPITYLTLKNQIAKFRDQPTQRQPSQSSTVRANAGATFYTAVQSSFIAPLILGSFGILPIRFINQLLSGLLAYIIAIPIALGLIFSQLMGKPIVKILVQKLEIHRYRASIAESKWVTRLSHAEFETALRSGIPPLVIIGNQTSQAARLTMPKILFAIAANSVESGYYEANPAIASNPSLIPTRFEQQSLPTILKITPSGQITSLDLANLNQALAVMAQR